jgi:purine-cytosine permease-like protein
VSPAERTQSGLDLFLVFAGANIVATTIVTGASLGPDLGTRPALLLIAAGSIAGGALVARLAALGPRLGVPSIVAARAALGRSGAGLLALVLYLTNFAWIALNNVIAASACARLLGGRDSERAWAVGLGLLATAVVAAGPRAVGWADRLAVPLMAAMAAVLLVSVFGHPLPGAPASQPGVAGGLRGFDLVVGYQVSWLLMFADYSRYTPSESRAGWAVFLALASTSIAFMTLGLVGGRIAGSADPADMLGALGWSGLGAPLLALATLTTNFVNIYVSALAWKSLRPATGDGASVWIIGGIGAALALLSRTWLDRYGEFMLLLGGLLVPVGGLLLARFFLDRGTVRVPSLYADDLPAWSPVGMVAWAAGAGVYFLPSPWGGTIPSLAITIVAWVAVRSLTRRPLPGA